MSSNLCILRNDSLVRTDLFIPAESSTVILTHTGNINNFVQFPPQWNNFTQVNLYILYFKKQVMYIALNQIMYILCYTKISIFIKTKGSFFHNLHYCATLFQTRDVITNFKQRSRVDYCEAWTLVWTTCYFHSRVSLYVGLCGSVHLGPQCIYFNRAYLTHRR